MRVATGSVLGLGEMPIDSAGKPLEMSTIAVLADARYSLPQWYADMEGCIGQTRLRWKRRAGTINI